MKDLFMLTLNPFTIRLKTIIETNIILFSLYLKLLTGLLIQE